MLTTSSESRLVELAKEGDDGAKEELARRHYTPLFYLALQVTGNKDDAEDIAQDSLLRFFKILDRFDSRRPIRPWLFQTARNRLQNRARRRKAWESSLGERSSPELELRGGLSSTEPDPEEATFLSEQRSQIYQALTEVPVAQREVLVLRDYQDLAYSEIAEVLNVPIGTVMSRLHGARKSLRKILLRDPATRGEVTPAPQETLVSSALVDPSGRPIGVDSTDGKAIISDLEGVNDQLLRLIDEEPDLIYQISPRKFEEVVAELLSRQGFSVELTPASRDGGVDIFAARKNSLGSFLYLVECKRYKRTNLVGVELVRQLYGVVEETKASAGILATTSFFTAGAKELQRRIQYRMKLHDYYGIQSWLKAVLPMG